MQNWLTFTIMAFFFYGFWGFFPKLAVREVGEQGIPSVLLCELIGIVAVCTLVLSLRGFHVVIRPPAVLYGSLTGLCGGLGTLCFLTALSRGKVSLVVTVTALYPLVSLFLAYLILKEPISVKQWCGIALAIMAMSLLAD